MAIKHLHIPEHAKQEMYAKYWSIPMQHTNSVRISGSICSKFLCVVKLAAELYRATSVARIASRMAWRYASAQISQTNPKHLVITWATLILLAASS